MRIFVSFPGKKSFSCVSFFFQFSHLSSMWKSLIKMFLHEKSSSFVWNGSPKKFCPNNFFLWGLVLVSEGLKCTTSKSFLRLSLAETFEKFKKKEKISSWCFPHIFKQMEKIITKLYFMSFRLFFPLFTSFQVINRR